MSRITYPDWQKAYEEALLEADPQQLPHRVSAAETAILRRLEAVRSVPDGRLELQAMQDALNSLSVLRRETEHRPENRPEHTSRAKARGTESSDGTSASE